MFKHHFKSGQYMASIASTKSQFKLDKYWWRGMRLTVEAVVKGVVKYSTIVTCVIISRLSRRFSSFYYYYYYID